MTSLFDSTFETDDAELQNLLAAARVKYFLDDLWARYSPFVTEQRKFNAGMKAQPFTRIWEMYLGCALDESGLVLESKGEEGSDFRLSNPRVWVEAVVSTDGQKPRTAGQPTSKVPEVLLNEWGAPPEDNIIWRWATSIDAKRKKFNDYLANGTVKQDEACVIGLNVHKTSFAQYDHQHTENHIPLIVKVLFGYGRCVALQLHNRKGLSPPISIDGLHYEFRPQVSESVPTDIFFKEEFSTISALIVSKEGFWSWRHRIPKPLSGGFIVIHNPLARNPLPRKWLKSGHEIWIEQGELQKQIWQNGFEHARETFQLPYNLPPDIRAKF